MVSLIQSVKAEVLPMATRLSLHIIPYFLSFQLLLLSPSLIAAGAAASVVSNSVWPHRWQPTRLPHPWDSPGKNTGVGCHFLLQCVKVKSLSRVRLLATPWTAPYQAPLSMGFSRQEHWSGVPLPSPLSTTNNCWFTFCSYGFACSGHFI